MIVVIYYVSRDSNPKGSKSANSDEDEMLLDL
jgi:hypothetical protein